MAGVALFLQLHLPLRDNSAMPSRDQQFHDPPPHGNSTIVRRLICRVDTDHATGNEKSRRSGTHWGHSTTSAYS
jgi:hypothetical protein